MRIVIIRLLFPLSRNVEEAMADFRGIPSPVCPACGGNLLNITASFNYETYEIDMYLLDNATCAECDALITAPTPVDLIL